MSNRDNVRRLRNWVVLILALTILSPVWPQWQNSIIDTITNTQIRKETEIQSLDLNSLDYVHLVWKQMRDGGGWRIFYATNSPDGVWSTPQEVCDSTLACFNPALSVSPVSDEPFIVLELSEEIYLAYWAESLWQRANISSNSQMDCSPTIAIDNLGYFHVAYITDDPGSGQYKIVYSFWDTVGWHIQTLTDSYLGPYGTGASPYIAVSPQGIAHIVYRGGDYGNYHIHHAWNDSVGGSTWNYEILMSGNGNDFAATLVIEGDEDLHLAVSGNDGFGFPGRVYYFYQPVGQSWQTPELASLSYSATRPAISVDFYGSPHVLWLETSGTMYTGNIFYSRRDTSGSWQVSSVIGQDHFFPSFKVDNEGFGHVACNTGGNSGIYDIYHIRSGEPLTAVEEYPFYHRESGLCYLSQNYPNPFRYYTIINYHIPNATIVTLKVYNILGEEVAALVNGFHSAGNYQAKWYVADIPSGVYFYRIQAGPFTQKKKCLLLK